jgi:Domain of unknown function (DUF5063)
MTHVSRTRSSRPSCVIRAPGSDASAAANHGSSNADEEYRLVPESLAPDDIVSFLNAASEYIAWVEERREATRDDLSTLHAMLARLQAGALQLPPAPPDDDSSDPPKGGLTYTEAREHLASLRLDTYFVVFNSLERDGASPLHGSLHDDLADIYGDLQDGLRYARADRLANAVWCWRFGYFSHWGRHLVHAQTAIWQYLADRGGDDT